jgi:hypothetical protein
MDTNRWVTIAYLFLAFVALVLLFAQLKMFSIDSNLKKILKILERKEEEKKEFLSTKDTEAK